LGCSEDTEDHVLVVAPFVIDGHDVDAIVARLGDAADAAVTSAAERRCERSTVVEGTGEGDRA
jgi:hypothetical protein